MNNQTDKLARTGLALIISGPSGSGKSTIYKEAIKQVSGFEFSVSCTTRAPREGEQDGKDYHFLNRKRFNELVEQGAFAEYAEVHGNCYGTLKSELLDRTRKGMDVLLDIDVQGAAKIQTQCALDPDLADACEFVFLAPPSYEELERRLRRRGTETEEVIQRRLTNARKEMMQWRRYGYLLVNDDLTQTVSEFVALITAFRRATKRFRKEPFS